MKIKVYSWLPNQPCFYIQFDDCNILLDTGLSMSSMDVFMPLQEFTNYSSDLFPIPHQDHKEHDFFKVLEKQAFITKKPLLHPIIPPEYVIRSLDAILISNVESFLALPYLVPVDSFRGVIYATDAVIEFAKLAMNDLLMYFERAEKVQINVNEEDEYAPWREYKFWHSFLNRPLTNPKEWRGMYSKLCIDTTIARATPIYLNSKVSINNSIEIMPTPSGFQIGSCNWLIYNGVEKISYITNSSVIRTHNKCMDLKAHAKSDILLLNSVNPNPMYNFNINVSTIKSIVFQTLMDLELIINVSQVLRHSTNFRDISIFYVAPNARTTIAYASRFPEYLISFRKNKCSNPEDPFEFDDLIKNNRLKIYDSFTDVLASEFRSPSIVITGHPSLRMGDVIHFMYMLGKDPRNSIVQVDPDYPFENLCGPFQKFSIKCFTCPLDYTLNETFVSSNLLNLINPKQIFLSDIYKPDLNSGYVTIRDPRVRFFRYGDVINTKCNKKFKDVLFSETMITVINMESDVKTNNLYSVKGFLNATDNKFIATSEDSRRNFKPLTKVPLYGSVDISQFTKDLKNDKIEFEVQGSGRSNSVTTIIISKPKNATVRVNNRINKTRIICDDMTLRDKLIKLLSKTLVCF
ncbi:Integrator complex subunit 9 [Strongyloides ratti]|uniref:Integrator complex subunit 9 n=1 Tax=Strongyloides ratti TaxID=34506 RepID=A0A090LFR0_STRRB|nr:Integrator complex subunit 9 [Strongyloides ratti]CEF68597.1 Integrator complex subunit 9 [Strongyloides ratti]